MSGSAWEFSWLEDWERVWSSSFLSEWNAMLDDAVVHSVYQTPRFLAPWARTVGARDDIRPLFGIGRHPAGHRILLPWIVTHQRGRFVERRVLEYAGRELSGYQDPIVVEAPDRRPGWDAFWSEAIRATRKRCDQGLMRHLSTETAPRQARPVGGVTPLLTLDGLESLEQLLSRCSPNHRGDVRRRFRRLDERGEVAMWWASDDQDGREAALSDLRERFLPRHEELCRAKGYSNPFASKEAGAFVEAMLDAGLSEGWVVYGALKLDGESIAWIVGLLSRNELYWWRPGYDLAWKKFSPGKILLARTLEHAIENGWSKVHFHTGEEVYKLAWKPDRVPLSHLTWYAPALRSLGLSLYDRFAGSKTA